MTSKKQRVVFNLADMIISGEKEGPLLPTNKEVGMIVASLNSLNMDSVICNIMGFSNDKIKYISNGYKLKKYVLSESRDFKIFDSKKQVKDLTNYNHHFIPSNGWKDYLLEGSEK